MVPNKTQILLFVKSDFHELLLSKEIQSRLHNSKVFTVKTKADAIRVLSTESIQGLVADIKADVLHDLYDIHQIHIFKPDLPIIAIVDDNSDNFSKKVQEIGVTELLLKDETFYVVIPHLLKRVMSKKAPSQYVPAREQSIKKSEHLKLTSRTLSHEINNPLMTILGIAELILDNRLEYDRDLVKKIKIIQKSALRIQQSTHRMTHISRPVFQKTPYGEIINPKKSRIQTKSKVKLAETE